MGFGGILDASSLMVPRSEVSGVSLINGEFVRGKGPSEGGFYFFREFGGLDAPRVLHAGRSMAQKGQLACRAV